MSENSNPNLKPNFFRRLRTTPLRDLARGRLSGNLDAHAIIAASGLPEELALIVQRVSRRTRLARVERVEVAHELLDHFRDGLAEGVSAPTLIEAFGDQCVAAKLIRRSMRRKQSVLARSVRQTVRAGLLCVAVVVVFYLLLAIKHRNREIRIEVDYVAMMNAPTLASEPSDRSWPEIREAITTLRGLARPLPDELMHVDREISKIISASLSGAPAPWIDAELGPPAMLSDDDDVEAARVNRFFEAAQPVLERLRAAAGRPLLGFPLAASGLEEPADRTFFGIDAEPSDAVSQEDADAFQDSILTLEFPHFKSVRLAARLLAADARRAVVEGDDARMVADIGAMLELAEQTRQPSIMIAQLVGMSMERLAFTVVLDLIAALPENIDDRSMLALAEMIRGLDDERVGLEMAGERWFFLDIAQRIYSDDGEGDGSLSIGSPVVDMLGTPSGNLGPEQLTSGTGAFLLGPIVAELTLGRAEAIRIWMNLMDSAEEQASKSPWEIDTAPLGLIDEIPRQAMNDDYTHMIRYFPINLLVPATESLVFTSAAIRLERDLVLTVLELEMTRRRDGRWPDSLDELEFTAGGEPARDPFDGSTVRYLRRDGRPLIYILGPDRDDDGGRGIASSGPGSGSWRDLRRGGLAGSSRGWGMVRGSGDSEPDGDIAVWAVGGE
jgi:hypothetical protein